MKSEMNQDNPFNLTDEQLKCENPLNKQYVRHAYTYAIASGISGEYDKNLIEGVIHSIRLKSDECTVEEFNQIMRGIANQAILSNLRTNSETLNKGTVEEAIIFLVNELRVKRQLVLQSENVNFWPRLEPFQTDEWLKFQIDWYENELAYFKELKLLGKKRYIDLFDFKDDSSKYIQLSLKKSVTDEAINLMYGALNGYLINASPKEFKRLFGTVGRQKFKKVEWTGSQAEIKAMFDLLKNHRIITNQNTNQLAEQCFFSLSHNIIARTLGSVSTQNTYILLNQEKDESHVLYNLIVKLKALKD